MKITSVIAEFNPLHLSHEYIIKKADKSSDLTAVILGGNFMQRGEVAITDCYSRARCAVECGADIVFLLPYAFSAQTAEIFAWGGVMIADIIGSSSLVFGSEDDGLPFYDAAKLLYEEPAEYRSILREGLDSGMSFASSRENAVRQILGEEAAGCLRGANNILSTEYTRAIIKRKSGIVPKSIKRISVNPSASVLRKLISEGNTDKVMHHLPECSREIITDTQALRFSEEFRDILFYHLLTTSEEHLGRIAEVESGLERRMIKNKYLLRDSIEAFSEEVSGKRYTKSRIRRILYNSLMGYTSSHLKNAKEHSLSSVIALAANGKGREFIKSKNGDGEVKIISNLSKEYSSLGKDRWIYDMELRAYEIYHRREDMSLLKRHTIVTD
ncbi:MAG: nucleotidyltransferase family protein [Eubacteriaceae bacterium]|nr:nucleotidyltransferase family protein [Eubacteriaceae bacterium]